MRARKCCPNCGHIFDVRPMRGSLADRYRGRVRDLREKGMTYQAIAKKLGMSTASAWAIGEGVR